MTKGKQRALWQLNCGPEETLPELAIAAPSYPHSGPRHISMYRAAQWVGRRTPAATPEIELSV